MRYIRTDRQKRSMKLMIVKNGVIENVVFHKCKHVNLAMMEVVLFYSIISWSEPTQDIVYKKRLI